MSTESLKDPKTLLIQAISNHISSLSDAAFEPSTEQIQQLLERPKKRELGDISLPCFQLASKASMSPPALAKELADNLPLPKGITEAKATGPFLNFSYERDSYIRNVLKDSPSQATAQKEDKKFAVVEYSSPNIAKPFHVGHLRATLIGNCLDRVYRACGWDVASVNHLGDWGTQFGFVWAGCEIWGKPADDSVLGLLEIYRKATGLKETQAEGQDSDKPDINEMARRYFIDLEAGEEYATEFWKWCSEISLNYFKQTYKRLDVSFDHYTGESFYSDKLDAVREELEDAGVLKESEQALGVDLSEFRFNEKDKVEDLGFARVFTPDGRSLYLTRDIATAIYRAKAFNFDRAVYVVGAPQTLHFKQLKGVLAKLEKPYADKLNHVAFGHVMGIKTRGDGTFVELNNFFDEATARALKAYQTEVSKRPEGLDENEVAAAVAHAAIVFSNISRNNIKDVHFDWDTALSFSGDSGPYLLYAYARINGIKAKAAGAGIQPTSDAKEGSFNEESAFLLAEAINDFEAVSFKVLEDHEPSQLTSYALNLAKLISKAYLDLKVVGVEQSLAEARLALFEKSRITMGRCLELMGIKAIERM